MYAATPNYSFLFYPPPYNFLAPPATMPKSGKLAPEDVLQPMGTGMGCDCGGSCGTCGMGQTDSSGLFGTGLFTSADFTQWGWGEWAVVIAGGYFAISAVNDLQSGYTGARKAYKKYSRKRSYSAASGLWA